MFAVGAEMAEKLPYGRLRTIITYWESSILVQVSFYPLILTFQLTPTANVGMVVHAIPDIMHLLEPIRYKAEELQGR